MKTAEEFNKELSILYSQLTDVYADIETAIARLVKKNHLEDTEINIPGHGPFKLNIKPGKIELVYTRIWHVANLEDEVKKEEYIKILEQLEDKVLI